MEAQVKYKTEQVSS